MGACAGSIWELFATGRQMPIACEALIEMLMMNITIYMNTLPENLYSDLECEAYGLGMSLPPWRLSHEYFL